MNLAAIDLNLLKAFDALYVERNVTRAGARIGLAQSSMSNALSRLRQLFGDELFLRTPQGMAPTARARDLAPRIAAALEIVRGAVEPAAAFDPMTANAEIAIATNDSIAATLGPACAAHFRAAAPHFDLRLRPLNKETIYGELDAGKADLTIGTFDAVPARFLKHDLFRDAFVCIARKDHPALADGLSLERFCAIPQVLMTLRGDSRGAVDQALEARGLTRRVALTVGQFLAVPDIVGRTDYIAAIPRSIADLLAERAGCRVFAMPLEIPRWTLSMLWSQASDSAPATRFAVSELKRCLAVAAA